MSSHPSFTRRSAGIILLAAILSSCGGGGSDGGGGVDPPPPPPPPPPAASVDFRDEIVYQLLTDRFANGDASNDSGRLDRAGDAIDLANPVGWHGGDFEGIRRKIQEGYFQAMGFTAIWISPVVLQVAPPGNGGGVNVGKPFVGFHGYWAERFDEIEPHFGELAALQALGATADAAGIKLVVDVVVNHAGPGSSLIAQHPTWFRIGNQCGSDEVTMCLAGLPDFRQEVAGVPDFLLGTIRYLRDNVPSIDGLRMDTMKHVGEAFWAQFFASGSPADPRALWTVGEVFDASVSRIAHYLDDVDSPAVFDFPLKFAIVDSLARGGSTRRLADVLAQDGAYEDPTRLATFLDNHDVWRFTSEAQAAGANATEADQRLDLALTFLYMARGVPVVYYGTEIAARGQGDSYDEPIGESSREDMDFAALAGSTFDERLRALADARKQHAALRRGAQRTLHTPGSDCEPPASSLDPAADFGDRLFVRGSFDNWAAPPPDAQKLVNLGGRQYAAAALLPAGEQQFKIAAADWTPEFSNPDRDTVPGVPITLRTAVGTTSNSRLVATTAGCHSFALDASSTSNPVLTVTASTTVAEDPDVFAFARTLEGQATVVVVLNNERTAVDLDSLPGGGVDVQGLVPDGAVTEITGMPIGNVLVSNGRLRGQVPALSAIALVD
ncbi:MAG: alpha-amylase family glycosyl hydrolase [Steroidobacteraceae bacterium]